MIERLAEEGWKATKWESFSEIIKDNNDEHCKLCKDNNYKYLVLKYSGVAEVYRKAKCQKLQDLEQRVKNLEAKTSFRYVPWWSGEDE